MVQTLTRNNRSFRQIVRKAIPVEAGVIHNTDVLANTDFFATIITPSDTPCLFRIMACFDTATVLEADVTNGGNLVTMKFNSGAQLTANCVYMFDMLVKTGDTINFQCTIAAKILNFIVQEIGWGVQ